MSVVALDAWAVLGSGIGGRGASATAEDGTGRLIVGNGGVRAFFLSGNFGEAVLGFACGGGDFFSGCLVATGEGGVGAGGSSESLISPSSRAASSTSILTSALVAVGRGADEEAVDEGESA